MDLTTLSPHLHGPGNPPSNLVPVPLRGREENYKGVIPKGVVEIASCGRRPSHIGLAIDLRLQNQVTVTKYYNLNTSLFNEKLLKNP